VSRIGLAFLAAIAPLIFAACSSDDPGDDGASDAASAESGQTDASGTPATGGAPADMQAQVAVMTELQSINQQLVTIRDQAFERPELQAQEKALREQVQAAMVSINPDVLQLEARFEEAQAEFAAAQQAGDQEKGQTLMAELQTLQGTLQQLQGQALEQEDVAASVETFREGLFAEMRVVDARSDSLMSRAEELNEQLQAAVPANMGGAEDGGGGR
jgi:chromosome segregation ATPase